MPRKNNQCIQGTNTVPTSASTTRTSLLWWQSGLSCLNLRYSCYGLSLRSSSTRAWSATVDGQSAMLRNRHSCRELIAARWRRPCAACPSQSAPLNWTSTACPGTPARQVEMFLQILFSHKTNAAVPNRWPLYQVCDRLAIFCFRSWCTHNGYEIRYLYVKSKSDNWVRRKKVSDRVNISAI